VIGGGPAGSATAIAMRQTFPALRVLLVEASEYDQRRVGEILPPMARCLLEHLGVLRRMSSEQTTMSRGLASAWGGPELEERDYFFGMAGEGWHLDRAQFDAMLGHEAEERGATVWLCTTLQESVRGNGRWLLKLSGRRPVTARWVIDATGRKAMIARRHDARQRMHDRLTAFSRISPQTGDLQTRILIESCAHGWWYHAPLPNGRCVTSLLTDADLARRLELFSNDGWRRALDETDHVRRLLHDAASFDEPMVRPAASVCLDRTHGDGWIAVGDAASAYDPLSARGITNALRSGILAAFAVGDFLCHGDAAELERYSIIAEAQTSRFARSLHEHYAREQRWSDQPFWMRRQRGAQFSKAVHFGAGSVREAVTR
jgi:flavin-dependent dehydrogenase